MIKRIGINCMKIKIVNNSKHPLPNYATALAAGMDLRANLKESIELFPLERSLIPTGVFIQLPEGYEAQIRPRSGLAVKHGVSIVNAPGTIDADYRGEIKVVLVNLSNEIFTVNDGERICQMVISKHERIEWNEVEMLDETERGEGGFGHTGKF
jgi:dUTP pyrophosphatase